jgi:glutamine synthetase type III
VSKNLRERVDALKVIKNGRNVLFKSNDGDINKRKIGHDTERLLSNLRDKEDALKVIKDGRNVVFKSSDGDINKREIGHNIERLLSLRMGFH